MSASASATEFEFNFTDAYSEDVFIAYAGGTRALRIKVKDTIANILKVMDMKPGIRNMTTQVVHDNKIFKVRVARSE